MKDFVKENAPGLITAGALALLSIFLAGFGSFLGAATIALILGMMLGNSKILAGKLEKGFFFTEKKVLETAIVLIGFGMNARIFSALGVGTWIFIGSSVILVIAVAMMLGRWFGLSVKMATLLGAGSAICGTAAIGAVSPLLHSKEEETGLSIGVINVLSTMGLLLLPVLSGILALNDQSSGLIIGGILQSMGHVVGAGFSLGEEVGSAATVVKMGRVLLIIPLMLILYFLNRGRKSGGKRMSFPVFVPLFALALALSQLPFFPAAWASTLAKTGDYLLITAMVAIGFKIKFRPLFRMAGPALGVGLLVFVFQILLYLLYLYL